MRGDLESTAGRFRVDRGLVTPLYHQVYTVLRNRILDGTYRAERLLPTEQELVTLFGVSRITVRRALNELAARGLIVREQGRGTRVATYVPRTRLRGGVEGLIENNRRMAAETEVEVLDFDYVRANEDVAEALHIKIGNSVQWAVRVRRLKGVPFSYLVTYVPENVGRTFQRSDLSATPLLVLLERSEVSVARAEQTITAISATPAVATALDVEPGSPLLHVVRIVFDQRERPVEYISAQYRPDIYRYTMSLARRNSPEGGRWATRD
jgi:GntR family transcriptional regulator